MTSQRGAQPRWPKSGRVSGPGGEGEGGSLNGEPAKVLVVGTDCSAVAAQALEEGRRLARGLGLTLELVHVREGAGQEEPWSPGAAAASWLGGVPESMSVRRGTPWIEIIRYAQERSAQMVVIGTHGLAGFQPLGLGSTASRLATLSPRPVVLVGPRTRTEVGAGL